MKSDAKIARKLRFIRNALLTILIVGIPLGTSTQKTRSAEDAPLTPNFLPLIASTFLGGAGDQRGTGISIAGGAIYVSGHTDANGNDGLVARYAIPLIAGAAPVWSDTWPTLTSYDDFDGIGVSSEGVYVAGQSFNRTTDTVGGKEGKGITVKYPLTGPPGGGFDGTIWDAQSPAPPSAFPYGGGEGLNAATVAIEGGLPFVYVTGNSQSSGINGGRLYVSKLNSAGTVLWTQTDAAATPYSQGSAITTLNGNVYIAGRNDDAGNQVYLVKYAPAGGPAIWTRKSITFNGNYYGITAFGGAIYAFGERTGGVGGSSDFLIEKWDEAGVLQWSKQYDRGSNEDILYAGVGLGSRVYAVGSTIAGSAGGRDIVLMELDPATGNLTGTTLFGGAQDDIARGAATDGAVIYVVGESRSFASVAGNLVGQNDLVLLSFGAGPTAAPATISGNVVTPDGAPLAGVTMRLSGHRSATTITDANGNYRFNSVDTDNFYTVTPSRVNYHFNPGNRSFSLLANMTDAVFTATPDGLLVGNAIDTAEYFVRQHYLDFLNREPDESGFNFWSDQIASCGDDAACMERKRINVSAAYFLSIEFQQTGGLVDGFYRASYGRAPRYAEFMPDTATIAQNIAVGIGDWQLQLVTNKRAFVAAWVQRSEFRDVYDSLSNASYVDTLISHTGVSYPQGERDELVNGLGNTLTRADVLLRIAENERFVQAKRNEAFVMMEYFGYLRRDPDAAGYQFWLDKLNQFEGNFERAEMVKAFLVSGEYRARFPR